MPDKDRSGRKSSREFAEQLNELFGATVAGNARLLTRFSNLINNATRELGARRPKEPRDATALLSPWLEFNLASYSAVTTHGLALLNGLLGAAEDALMAKPSGGTESPEPPGRVELRLMGRPGERVTSGFVVENHFDRPLEVGFESGDLIPGAGPSLPGSLVTFQPAKLSIAPRAQAVIEAVVTITADFVVGETYTTTISLLGFKAKEVGFALTVLAPVGTETVVGRSLKESKTGSKRRRSSRRTSVN